jgi:hypothetical protein
MHRKPLEPLPPSSSIYGIGADHSIRAKDLPNIAGVLSTELFPKRYSPVIYPGEDGLRTIRQHTEASLEHVDMSMIKPSDSVNILCSHHSFYIMGGEPYAELIRTVKEVVHKRTGAGDIRLLAGVGLRYRESEEYIKKFNLDEYFDGKAWNIAPVDRGIPVETSIGTLYGLKRVYDADWIIHTHNTDIREVHFHRMVDRILKPFAMSYARVETRSIYHSTLGPRGANYVARAIYDSELVRNKIAFSTIMKIFPVGITGVESDNNLLYLNDRITVESLLEYGKVVTLLGKIPECILILDCPGPIPYTIGGGLIFGNFVSANIDQFDLDNPVTPYPYAEFSHTPDGEALNEDIPPINPAIKMLINHYSFKGYPSAFFSERIPTVVIGKKMAELFRNCPQNGKYMTHALTADSLEAAINFAYGATGTRNVIIFDGAKEGFNASTALIDFLLQLAPEVDYEVETYLLPKWIRQRGLDPKLIDQFRAGVAHG